MPEKRLGDSPLGGREVLAGADALAVRAASQCGETVVEGR
jgi:hypothetical protein